MLSFFKLVLVSVFVTLMAILPTSSLAGDVEDIQVHGFVSQGFLRSTSHNYLGSSRDGSLEFNEIGINFAIPISDELRFGFQLFSRDLGDIGNNVLMIDWAFIDYQFNTELGMRLGKIKAPVGLFNRQRDADMLRTTILLDQSVYPEYLRNFMVAIHGASIYGTFTSETIGYLEYELFGGSIESAMHENLSAEMTPLAGGALIWNAPVPGLRLGGSYAWGEGDMTMNLVPWEIEIDGITVLSLSEEIGNLTFNAEYFTTSGHFSSDMFGSFPIDFLGTYASTSYHFTDWFVAAVSYSEYYQDADDKDGLKQVYNGLPEYFGWQKDWTFSTRFNLTDFWSLKGEVHAVNGAALTTGLGSMVTETGEEDWYLFALKTSISF